MRAKKLKFKQHRRPDKKGEETSFYWQNKPSKELNWRYVIETTAELATLDFKRKIFVAFRLTDKKKQLHMRSVTFEDAKAFCQSDFEGIVRKLTRLK